MTYRLVLFAGRSRCRTVEWNGRRADAGDRQMLAGGQLQFGQARCDAGYVAVLRERGGGEGEHRRRGAEPIQIHPSSIRAAAVRFEAVVLFQAVASGLLLSVCFAFGTCNRFAVFRTVLLQRIVHQILVDALQHPVLYPGMRFQDHAEMRCGQFLPLAQRLGAFERLHDLQFVRYGERLHRRTGANTILVARSGRALQLSSRRVIALVG